ncbi:hypothetical protein [Streptomyces sp. NPDC059258]|uniref:hypothetical protein n=1 Tax=unclassified Streptomyces TaxID=2593676 RepID=UPI0036CA5235
MTTPPRRRTTQPGPGERAAASLARRAAANLAASFRTIRADLNLIDATTDNPEVHAATTRIRAELNRREENQ